jgi:hypothetical protein
MPVRLAKLAWMAGGLALAALAGMTGLIEAHSDAASRPGPQAVTSCAANAAVADFRWQEVQTDGGAHFVFAIRLRFSLESVNGPPATCQAPHARADYELTWRRRDGSEEPGGVFGADVSWLPEQTSQRSPREIVRQHDPGADQIGHTSDGRISINNVTCTCN